MMRRRGGFFVSLFVLAAAVAPAVSQDSVEPPKPGHTPDRQPPTIDFGMVGLTRGQTARISMINPGTGNRKFPPGPCRVTLRFLAADGSLLLPCVKVLEPGESHSHDLNADDLLGDATGALLVRATVMIESVAPNHFPPSPCRAAIEVIQNSSQRTTLFVAPTEISGFNPQPEPPGRSARVPPGADVAFNPQPEPPGLPMLGLTRGQTLRLNVANVAPDRNGFPPGPCRALVRFLDETGNQFGSTREITVDGGKAGSVLLNADALLGESEARRIQIRPDVQYVSSPVADLQLRRFPPGPCMPVVSVELVDNATAQSTVYLSPATIRSFEPNRISTVIAPEPR
jgi:hypothetical protein